MSTAGRHTIGKKLEYLRQQLDRLEAYRTLPDPEILGNEERRLAVERLLELSVQSVTDCSRLLVSQNDWRGLRDERDAFAILAERRVIPSNLADRLTRAKAFRNVLVHDYVEIDSEYLISVSLRRGFDRSMKSWCTSLRWRHGRALVSRLPGTLQAGCRTHRPGR